MTSRQLIKDIIDGKTVERCGFWMGQPHKDTWPILLDYFKVDSESDVRTKLHDDIFWLSGERGYKSPDGGPMFNNQRKGEGLSSEGVFSDCTDVDEVHKHQWPDPKDFDFTELIETFKNCGSVYRLSGLWSPFFHRVADMFGMENYFIKMYTDPEVVHAVTTHIVDFYLAGTRKLFEEAGDEIDGFFFGNDFGTQLDTLISPECFEEFVFPYFRKLTELGHEFDKHVFLHSCGSIYKVIPRLLELGVDVLHPLQAKAANMDADTLSKFKGKVTFLGGIDTQDLLVNGSPEDVIADTKRVIKALGPQLIISPSHECLLPNIPPQNVEAMSQTVFN